MDYYISGVKVKFPCKAYAPQVAMMEKVRNVPEAPFVY